MPPSVRPAAKIRPAKNAMATARVLVGAILFGIGWGMAGYCPGPALASLFTGGTDILWFLGAMLPGMLGAKKWFS